jgi:lactoylglutathione lyase
MRLDYAIIFVGDMRESVAFYRDVIGLPLRFESPHWTEFATEGATLALHASDAPALPADPAKTPAGYCKPGFGVTDLDGFHQRMVDRGVRCIQPPKDVFGTRIAQYLDPDGLALSVSENRKSR